ncbi:hypothetical protein niasHS_018163 [Heterodera schachtii]|uniref:G protein-coupled receptor n=1 Tax=Heterodera schachtii TaxID=97005 RepID=A0ABD2I8F2_HETSC
MRPLTSLCTILSLFGVLLNILFLVVTRLQRVERIQEVLIFLRSISIGYILVALSIMAVAPQSITLASANIRIPHGLLVVGNAGASSNFMSALAAFGVGSFLFTAFSFLLLFLYHYRKTAGQMSTVFAPKNVPVFVGVAFVYCLVQSVLLYYSKVEPSLLLERLSRSKKWEQVQLNLGMNPNNSFAVDGSGGGGGGGGAAWDKQTEAKTGAGGQQIAGGFQSITGGSNYSTLSVAIESRQYDQSGVSGLNGGGGGSENRYLEGTFGTDYSRNPLYFLSNGVLMITFCIISLSTIITSIAVKCNLRGRQENMSDKSQEEMRTFTNVLILEAYIPTLLMSCAGVNYVVCFVMGESAVTTQEFLGISLIAPIPVLFPLINLLCLKEFRNITSQIVLCKIWMRKKRQERAAAERKAQENIDEDLVSASKNKLRNKRMPNSTNGTEGQTQKNVPSEARSEGGATKSTASKNRPEDKDGRYTEATDNSHRESRALFGKQ